MNLKNILEEMRKAGVERFEVSYFAAGNVYEGSIITRRQDYVRHFHYHLNERKLHSNKEPLGTEADDEEEVVFFEE